MSNIIKKTLLVAALALATTARAENLFKVYDADGAVVGTYATLQAAMDATVDKGTIRLLGDATWSGAVSIVDKRVTITSEGATRRTLTRTAADAIVHLHATSVLYPTGSDRYVDKVNDYDVALGADLCLTNVIVDGGAVWLDPDDPTSTANSGISGGGLADAYGSSPQWDRFNFATVTLANGATVQNYNQADYLVNGYIDSGKTYSGIRIFEGAEIVDCRGDMGLYTDNGNSGLTLVRMTGGTITRCSSAATELFHLEIRAEESAHKFTGGAITNNYVVDTAHGTIYVQPNQGLFVNSVLGIGGSFKIFNNYAMSGEAANIRLSTANPTTTGKDKVRRLAIVEPLTAEANIWASMANGDTLSSVMGVDKAGEAGVPTPNADKIVYDGSPVEGYKYVGANKDTETTDLVWTQGEPMVLESTYRYSTDGGATWTESMSLVLDTCGGLLGATAAGSSVGTPDQAIIELLKNVKLGARRGINRSLTIRSGAGGPYKLTVNGASTDAGLTLYATDASMSVVVSNIVVDGGIKWMHDFDVTKSMDSNAAAYNANYGGALFYLGSYIGTLKLDKGTEIRNFRPTYSNSGTRRGLITFAHGSPGSVEIVSGVKIHDVRGGAPVICGVTCSAARGGVLTIGATLIWNCCNTRCTDSSNDEFQGILTTCSPNTVMDTYPLVNVDGLRLWHCQASYGAGFLISRQGDRNNSAVVNLANVTIVSNAVTRGGGALYSYHNTGRSITFSGKCMVKDSWLVNFDDGRKVRCNIDDCHYRPYGMSPAEAYKWHTVAADLDLDSEIWYFTGEYSAETDCYKNNNIQRQASQAKCTFATIPGEYLADGDDAAILSCIRNDIFTNLSCCIVQQTGTYINRLAWKQGPNYVAPTEVAAQLIKISDGTVYKEFKTFREALAADDSSKYKIKLLKDGVFGGMYPQVTHYITSDTPVTIWTHCGPSGDAVGRIDASYPSTKGLYLGGQVSYRRAVLADNVGTLLFSGFQDCLSLSGQAHVYGNYTHSLDRNIFYVSGSPTLDGYATSTVSNNLFLVGALSDTTIKINNSNFKTVGKVFGEVGANYATPRQEDAHCFANYANPGMCGMLLDNKYLVWIRNAATITDAGAVDTFTYSGALNLGANYAFTVNASADYLNGAGKKGVYPLVRATSVTGQPTLVLPKGVKGQWAVQAVYDGATLVGYDLKRIPSGLILLMR